MALITKANLFGEGRIFGVHNPFSKPLSKASDRFINLGTLRRLSFSHEPDVRNAVIENITSRFITGLSLERIGSFNPSVVLMILDRANATYNEFPYRCGQMRFLDDGFKERSSKDLIDSYVAGILPKISHYEIKQLSYADLRSEDFMIRILFQNEKVHDAVKPHTLRELQLRFAETGSVAAYNIVKDTLSQDEIERLGLNTEDFLICPNCVSPHTIVKHPGITKETLLKMAMSLDSNGAEIAIVEILNRQMVLSNEELSLLIDKSKWPVVLNIIANSVEYAPPEMVARALNKRFYGLATEDWVNIEMMLKSRSHDMNTLVRIFSSYSAEKQKNVMLELEKIDPKFAATVKMALALSSKKAE